MNIIDKGDIITLSNDKKYVVAEVLDYYDEEYMMLFEVDENQVFEQAKFIKTKQNNYRYSIINIKSQNDYIAE